MKKIVYGAVAALVMATTGCTGTFQVMQAVHRWHRNFEEPWTDECCYLAAVIFQIYSAAYTVDTIFFNSAEFWTGSNPLMLNTADATITRLDVNTALVKHHATGEVYTLKRTAEGGIALTDAQGNTVTAQQQGALLTMALPSGATRTVLM